MNTNASEFVEIVSLNQTVQILQNNFQHNKRITRRFQSSKRSNKIHKSICISTTPVHAPFIYHSQSKLETHPVADPERRQMGVFMGVICQC